MILLGMIRLVKPLIMKPRSPRSVLRDQSWPPVPVACFSGVAIFPLGLWPPPRETCAALGPNTSPRMAGYPEMGLPAMSTLPNDDPRHQV